MSTRCEVELAGTSSPVRARKKYSRVVIRRQSTRRQMVKQARRSLLSQVGDCICCLFILQLFGFIITLLIFMVDGYYERRFKAGGIRCILSGNKIINNRKALL